MFTIENEHLKISVRLKGAELTSIYSKDTGLEYLWNGDPAFWPRQSPVLFPVVGGLKDNTYYFEGKPYQLDRHGFARDLDFRLAVQSDTQLSFILENDAATLQRFPFPFRLTIGYDISNGMLSVIYKVENTGNTNMYFSVGAHPAFKLPLADGTSYQDYYLEFDQPENTGRWPISKSGLLENEDEPLLENTRLLPLNKDLFKDDAIVLKHLRSNHLQLKAATTTHGLEFGFKGFPYLGIWAAPGADFVCIEPWCGITDHEGTDQQLIHKEGVQQLFPQQLFERSWTVRLF